MKLQPHESTPANNPNHPRIRCVDGVDPYGNWAPADDTTQKITGPYRVFDILNQEHVGKEFSTWEAAEQYMQQLGGSEAPKALPFAMPKKPHICKRDGVWHVKGHDLAMSAVASFARQDAFNAARAHWLYQLDLLAA